jgi:hypothetical protein
MQALEKVAKQGKAEALQERESADKKVAEARAEQETVEEAAAVATALKSTGEFRVQVQQKAEKRDSGR